MRQHCRLAVAVWAAVLLLEVGCRSKEEELPPVKHQTSWLQPPAEGCALPPAPPRVDRRILSKPTDPGRCLAVSSTRIMNQSRVPRETLPVEFAVSSDGRVVAVEFHDSCMGVDYPVDPATAACIRKSIPKERIKLAPPSRRQSNAQGSRAADRDGQDAGDDAAANRRVAGLRGGCS
jgi:hypothetical protein